MTFELGLTKSFAVITLLSMFVLPLIFLTEGSRRSDKRKDDDYEKGEDDE